MSSTRCQCGRKIPKERVEAGFYTCIVCGHEQAQQELQQKFRQIAPYCNKGAYMLITNPDSIKGN